MDLGFGDATAVVTGGTKGMGRAAAESLAGEGARVAVVGRSADALAETERVLRDLGSPEVLALSADLTDDAAVRGAFAEIASHWDDLNVLVNVAGPVDVGINAFDDLDDAEWVATFDIGTLSAVRCVRAALPLLRRAAWARVVNVSAHSTKRQSPTLVAYTASKAALTSVTKNLSLSLAPEGILVNCVSPGSFNSAGMRGLRRLATGGPGG